jgi:hypothetical protein
MIPLLRDFERARNVIETDLGGIVDGRFIFCGLDVNREIGGRMTQTEVLLLWLLGRKPEPMETRLMDALITLNAYPDIRIWSVRAGAFAASAGSPIPSACAASHTSHNAALFGVGASIAFRRLISRLADISEKPDFESVVKRMLEEKTVFQGFGRPLVKGPDERVKRLTDLLAEWNYPLGRYMLLYLRLAEIIEKNKGLYPNFASIHVALLIDPPFRLSDAKLTAVSQFIINIAAITPICEIAEREIGMPLLPLRIQDIDYRGIGARRFGEKKRSL